MSGITLQEVLTQEGLQVEGHNAFLREVREWGGPTSYLASCSCRWESIEYVNCSPTILVKVLQDFVERWGMEQYELISRTAFRQDASELAIRALLQHLQYQPSQEILKLQEVMKRSFYSLQRRMKEGNAHLFSVSGKLPPEVVDEFHDLEELGLRYQRLLVMKNLVAEVREGEAPVVNMKAYKEYKKIMETLGGQS